MLSKETILTRCIPVVGLGEGALKIPKTKVQIYHSTLQSSSPDRKRGGIRRICHKTWKSMSWSASMLTSYELKVGKEVNCKTSFCICVTIATVHSVTFISICLLFWYWLITSTAEFSGMPTTTFLWCMLETATLGLQTFLYVFWSGISHQSRADPTDTAH